MKQRIWELDALRGVCILGMVVIHFVFDSVRFFGLFQWQFSHSFQILMDWGGVLFLLISGICATLGARSVRRGLTVFGCGMLITAVTAGMYALDLAGRGILIYFGILHCLGLCMMLWHILRKLPAWALAALSAAFIALGLWFRGISVDTDHFLALGLTTSDFASADFFPLLPNLGFFLLGAALGRTLYRKKETLLPRVNAGSPMIRFFAACGRHSLEIYLLHQPAIALVVALLGR